MLIYVRTQLEQKHNEQSFLIVKSLQPVEMRKEEVNFNINGTENKLQNVKTEEGSNSCNPSMTISIEHHTT